MLPVPLDSISQALSRGEDASLNGINKVEINNNEEIQMRQFKQTVFIALALVFVFATSGCGNTVPVTPAELPPTVPVPTATEMAEVEATPEDESVDDPEFALPDFEAAKFSNPTEIDNQYFPMTPGSHSVFEGITEEGGRDIPHSIIFTVTDLTKEIMGVNTVVAYIEDYSNNQLVEAEIAFYAQADDGTVWFMGEHPEVYEDGVMVEAPTWIPGLKGAQAGIVMKADPQMNMPSYGQGWGPAVNWTDRGRVVGMGEQTCVPVACYENVLVTEEFNQSEPDAFQVKYYAPSVGNVRVGWRGEDASHEELELVEYTQLNPDDLAEIRATALALEAHAYEISKEVYSQTKPSEYKSP
jgi:hypothetical protein